MTDRFDFTFGSKGADGGRRGSGPTRVAFVGDLGGDRSAPLRERRPVRVDAETFDAAMARIEPRVRVELGEGAPSLDLRFRELEDFHPDRLFERVESFEKLRAIRRRLLEPSTFEEEAESLRRSVDAPVEAPPEPEAAGDAASDAPPRDDLARLLGGAPAGLSSSATGPAGARSVDLAGFFRRAIGPHIVADRSADRDALVGYVDEGISDHMRELLRHPRVRALETTWLGLRDLVAGEEAEDGIECWVLDAGRDEIAADIAASAADLTGSALHRAWLEHVGPVDGPGPQWALTATGYTFGDRDEDPGVLAGLAIVSAGCGGPVLVGADPGLAGATSFAGTPDPAEWDALEGDAAERWSALRSSPAARFVGLVAPRVLARMPYGSAYETTDRFRFEEIVSPPSHEDFAWQSGVFVAARALVAGFATAGVDAAPGAVLEIGDLPHVIVERAGERDRVPCAEGWLSDRAVDAMLRRGLLPIVSRRDRNAVRIARFRSFAADGCDLAGAWSG